MTRNKQSGKVQVNEAWCPLRNPSPSSRSQPFGGCTPGILAPTAQSSSLQKCFGLLTPPLTEYTHDSPPRSQPFSPPGSSPSRAHAIEAQEQYGVDLDTTKRIMEEGLQSTETLALYTYLTDVIGPRLAGTPAFKRSADWAVERLRGWGLDDVHLESFEFGRGWTLEGLTLEMTEPRYFPLTGFPEAWTPSTDGELLGKPIYVGDKTAEEMELLRPQLAGAVVLTTPPQPEFITEDRLQPAASEERVPIGAPSFFRSRSVMNSRELSAFLQEAGVAAVLRPNQGQHGTIFVTGNRNTANDAVPSIVMASEHYNMIVRMLEAGEDVRLRVGVKSQYHEEDPNSYNVLAEIPGTDPDVADEIVLIGGHLDSWHSSPGGSDNADGSPPPWRPCGS